MAYGIGWVANGWFMTSKKFMMNTTHTDTHIYVHFYTHNTFSCGFFFFQQKLHSFQDFLICNKSFALFQTFVHFV